MMSYPEFKDRLLMALMRVANAKLEADPNSLGIVDAFDVAANAGLPEQEQWVSDAVQTFETKRWVHAVRPLSGRVELRITGEGREQAERLATQYIPQHEPKKIPIGFESTRRT